MLNCQFQLQNNLANAVIVHIFTSKANIHVKGQNVGHVSIELPSIKRYISLWPPYPKPHTGNTLISEIKDTIRDAFSTFPMRFPLDYEEEIHEKGGRRLEILYSEPDEAQRQEVVNMLKYHLLIENDMFYVGFSNDSSQYQKKLIINSDAISIINELQQNSETLLYYNHPIVPKIEDIISASKGNIQDSFEARPAEVTKIFYKLNAAAIAEALKAEKKI